MLCLEGSFEPLRGGGPIPSGSCCLDFPSRWEDAVLLLVIGDSNDIKLASFVEQLWGSWVDPPVVDPAPSVTSTSRYVSLQKCALTPNAEIKFERDENAGDKLMLHLF
jgi:hypothetical protein